ncbi:hypothetical protein ACVI1J_004777 [Bradyrhizobium diazoefficiens]
MNGGLWSEAEPPSNLTSCLLGCQCCFADLRFDLREPCLGGCYGGFCLRNEGEGVRMRPLSHSQLHLSSSQALPSLAGDKVSGALLAGIGGNCLDGNPG